jgi:hypothetical protein
MVADVAELVAMEKHTMLTHLECQASGARGRKKISIPNRLTHSIGPRDDPRIQKVLFSWRLLIRVMLQSGYGKRHEAHRGLSH